jgi:predicted transposase/invertase (TIGR01784 family)
MGDSINNIHDKYVRESFSDPGRAAASLEIILPKELRDILNLSTLQVVKETYVDKVLSEYFSDLVFEVETYGDSDKRLDVALLFEHKSRPDKNVLIQVGYYLFAHFHKCVLDKKPLKPVIPIIYYQGKKNWKVKDLSDIFSKYPKDIKDFLPVIHHIFVSLHSVQDDTLLSMKDTMMGVAMIAQKWRNNPVQIVEDIIRLFSLFQDELQDRNFLQQTFVYMMSTSDVASDDVKKIIESIPLTIKEDIMTTYARIAQENKLIGEQIGIQKGEQIGIQKGEQIGIQKGENNKQIEFILSSFDNGVSISLVANITKLTENVVIKILKENGKM